MSLITRADLKPFQERAASALAGMIQDYPSPRFKSRFNPDTGEVLPFLCRLRAITGAGKTPILALAAQHLRTGLVLWTTNRGAVILQTLLNLRPGGKYSALLPEGTQVYVLGEMSGTDWEQAMAATDGLTILLSTVAAFNQDGDTLKIHQGDPTRWKMLSGAAPGGRVRPLFVFYDEGHGATDNQFQRLRELNPKAFVLASASPLPDDLADLLAGKTQEERQASMADRTINVPTTEVVQAGLLKSRLYFMDCNTAQADAIREANGKWLELSKKLAAHGKAPIVCFIVNDTSRGVDIWEHLVEVGISPQKIAVHLNGARDVIYDRKGSLDGLIDTYSGKKPVERSPEILARGGYTHIIWNLTLREGWDEPLAYVAYIDEKGKSLVDIVQKIGRFVRQPDATPFDDPDLNAAYFYFNVTDQAFTALIASTQAEMESEGYEIISMEGTRRPPASRLVPVRTPKTLTRIAPWFGDNVEARDQVLLDSIPLFTDRDLRSDGSIKTRVIEMSTMQEDLSKRKEEARDSNESITPWEFLSIRLGAIDSRIIDDNGSIFSATLKDNERLRQPMQSGSQAMTILTNTLPQIKDRLNDMFQLRSLGRHGVYNVQPFNLVSPDIEGGAESYRQKYKVRTFKDSLHAQYNGFNPFELRVAENLDALGLEWCRNPVSKDAYRIPIQELGSDSVWFYPDFLLWTKKEVWALDPKGKHLLESAVAHKLLDLNGLKGVTPAIKVAFILEGQYGQDGAGKFYKKGKGTDGVTLVQKAGVQVKAQHFNDLKALCSGLK